MHKIIAIGFIFLNKHFSFVESHAAIYLAIERDSWYLNKIFVDVVCIGDLCAIGFVRLLYLPLACN